MIDKGRIVCQRITPRPVAGGLFLLLVIFACEHEVKYSDCDDGDDDDGFLVHIRGYLEVFEYVF